MPSALYRPLEQSLKEYNDDYHDHPHRSHGAANGDTATYVPLAASPGSTLAGRHSRNNGRIRRYLILALISLIFIYFLWCSLTTITGADVSNADNELEEHGTDSTNSKILNESLFVCNEVYTDTRLYIQNQPIVAYASLPVIYFVTPTYPRREQVPELTRLAHTLLHVPRLHWIVADDHDTCNVFLDYLLNKFGIPYTHLASPMPSKFRSNKPAPRGVANRRAALQWLRQHNLTNGILYFGDDDNTYDLKLFSEIRETRRVSMFPVGLVADYSISGPVVRKGKVVGFLDSWVADRRWPVDMAGFAVNLGYMSQFPAASMPYKPGYEEDFFLRSVRLRMEQIEPKGNNCSEVLVWHTQTKSKKRPVVRIKSEMLDDRLNLGALFKALEIMGVAKASETEGVSAILSKNGKAKPHSFFLS